mmetsp:Transcript_24046/g.59669  ORF Transcript_24046/g.59669 Transcript_24046/m.59669 type:complete len:605 (-) Transcript_24046:72-1886(-)
MSLELRRNYTISPVTLTAIFVVSTLGALIFAALLLSLQLITDRQRDPRWDDAGFRRWANKGKVRFIKLSYILKIARLKIKPPTEYADVYHGYVYDGAPPSHVDIISLVAAPESLTDWEDLIEWLKVELTDEHDPDMVCIFFPPWSISTKRASFATALANRGELRMSTYYRVRVLVSPVGVNQLLNQASPMVKLILSSYCQRIINAKEPSNKDVMDPKKRATLMLNLRTIKDVLDPKKLADVQGLLDERAFKSPAERRSIIASMNETFRYIKPIKTDQHGFNLICEIVQVRWLKISYVKDLARKRGPFPRMQDLKTDGVYVGLPPGRKITLSHGWSAEMHPCPSGEKMERLVQKLEAYGLDKEGDGVFIDYCSLPQKAFPDIPQEYFDNTLATSPMQDRTPMERVQFNFAMHEMTRLYAFEECHVIVDPIIDAIDEADIVLGKLLPGAPRTSRWGMVNDRKYEKRGWCCAEFAVAYFNKRIKNLDDPAVRDIIKSRKWPKTIDEYAEMMSDNAMPKVEFTNKGDKSTVLYNFYKMTSRIKPYRYRSKMRLALRESVNRPVAKQYPPMISPGSPRRASSAHSTRPGLWAGTSFHESSSSSLHTRVI